MNKNLNEKNDARQPISHQQNDTRPASQTDRRKIDFAGMSERSELASPYNYAINWFRDCVNQHSEDIDERFEYAEEMRQSFTAEQHLILQRGFDFRMYGRYSLLDNDPLDGIEFEVIPNRESELQFPVRRVERSLT